MEKITFEEGTIKKQGYVLIDGQEIPIVDTEYEGNTPLSPYILNRIQSNINEISYLLKISTATAKGAEITMPCYYKVGQGTLDVYINGERLILSSDDAGTDGHYREVGEANSISNKIKLTSDWGAGASDSFIFVVRGEYSNDT